MHRRPIPQSSPWSALLVVAALTLPAMSAYAVTPAEADAAFAALNRVYWDPAAKFFRRDEHGSRKADFWFAAQLWDTVMDQYDRTHSAEARRQIDDLYDGFIKEYPDWTTNKYNDDIMWWAIACARAYELTNDERYLQKSKESFDFVYDNFLDEKFGGGLYWINERTSKNSCINSPAVIAAARLSVLLKDPAYLDKAKSLYAWQKQTLTDGTGKVFDSVGFDRRSRSVRTRNFSLTYNQGTFIGAAVLLYRQTGDKTYLDDALKAADWTKANLCVGDARILQSEGQGDGGAFKGIFARYMKRLVDDCGRSEYLPWMQANAAAAWRNRRSADDLMGHDWSVPAGTKIESQTATSAVAMVLCFADEDAK
jgi:predicted alpha-1,6-mannanase (GH76 family)